MATQKQKTGFAKRDPKCQFPRVETTAVDRGVRTSLTELKAEYQAQLRKEYEEAMGEQGYTTGGWKP